VVGGEGVLGAALDVGPGIGEGAVAVAPDHESDMSVGLVATTGTGEHHANMMLPGGDAVVAESGVSSARGRLSAVQVRMFAVG
jgi:hypothetical protein